MENQRRGNDKWQLKIHGQSKTTPKLLASVGQNIREHSYFNYSFKSEQPSLTHSSLACN